MAELVFYRHKYGKPLDHAIGYATLGAHSHVEFKLTDTPANQGPCLSSSFRDKGVRHRMIKLASGRWTRYRISPDVLSLATEQAIAEWFAGERGKKYDLLGVFMVPFTFWKNKLFRRSRWFCSEVTSHICRRWSIFEFPTTQLSPSRMERICKAHPEVFEPIPSMAGPSCHIEGYPGPDSKVVRRAV